MKKLIFVLIIPSVIICQNFDFNLHSDQCQDCENYARARIGFSSLWLSESPIINLMSKQRIIIQTGLASTIKKQGGEYWNYPNLDVGIKATNNLAVTIKIFGFKAGNDSPQVIGGGLHYAYGTKDSLNWVTSLQRVDLKGLNHFRLSSLTLDIKKYMGGERRISIHREITKMYEETFWGSINESIDYFSSKSCKGEFVFIVAKESYVL